MKKSRTLLSELFFWIHFIMVAGWATLFLVPSRAWDEKVKFHFMITLIVVIHQVLWGFILSLYTKRFDLVCILTTLTHMARGEKFTTDLNYVYKWSTEFCSRIGLELSPRLAGTIVLSGLMIVSVQFLII
ncbi:MAG: hypothetical protein WBK67_03520 [Minisyncoccales bacterium]|jgi:hypothetical protein